MIEKKALQCDLAKRYLSPVYTILRVLLLPLWPCLVFVGTFLVLLWYFSILLGTFLVFLRLFENILCQFLGVNTYGGSKSLLNPV